MVGRVVHQRGYYPAHGGHVWGECFSADDAQRIGGNALGGRSVFKLAGGSGAV